MLIGSGVYWFFTGFRTLKSSRTIQNIPTSRISTGAVGTHVEIKGNIVQDGEQIHRSPLSGQICVFYSVEIQKLVRTKNRNHWRTIDHFYSSPDFTVDDKSGAVAKVFVAGATIQRRGKIKEFEIGSNDFASMPAGLTQALQRNANQLRNFELKDTSWLFSRQYRFLEWFFAPKESVYILGYAESGIKQPKAKKLSFDTFLKAKKTIEADLSLQNRFDSNQDGFLATEELERGAMVVGHGLQVETPPTQEKMHTPNIKMVFRKQKGVPYILSNMKEMDLVKQLSWKAALKVWGGPVVAIAGAIYLYFTQINFKGLI
jgi:hypothetical protein